MLGPWLIRTIGNVIRWLGWPTVLSLLLLLIALGSVVIGLADIIRGFDTRLMLLLMTGGLFLSWGLARSPLPGWLAGFIILALGSELLLLRIGQLGDLLIALGRALLELIGAIWRWPWAGPPDGRPAWQAVQALGDGLRILLTRLFDWGGAMVTGQSIFDPVAATLVWGLVIWLVASWAGWTVRRHRRPLLALTPAGALLVISLGYAPGRPVAAVPPLLVAALLLVGLVAYDTQERRWQAAGLDFPLDVRLETTVVMVFLSAALVTLATMSPAVSVRQIARLARQMIGEQIVEARPVVSALGMKESAGGESPLEKIRAGGLPRDHLLGTGPELSEQVVMVIQATESPSRAPGEPPPRYYWRSISYDRYSGRGWFAGETETVAYEAGEPIDAESEIEPAVSSELSTPQRIVQQEVRLVEEKRGLLYATGELITADHEFSVAWRGTNDLFGATIEATSYRATSRLPLAREEQLRQAGSNYPAWVRQRYLALPDDIPQRVLTLARDLTATAPTPYDRAKTIESHLRTFPYNLDLPAPPRERDIVDYFLFDLQQGYCDYYATSMVVLARAAGLPARMAIGYINGTYDPVEDRYVVTEAEAHSWVEIYFPGHGWVNFEPTAGRPTLDRATDEIPAVPPELAAPLETASTGDGLSGRFWWWLALPAALILLSLGGTLAWTLADGWRLRQLDPAEAIVRLYRRLYRHAYRLETPIETGHTPHEFAILLSGQLSNLARHRRGSRLLSPARQEVDWLTELYVRALYSPHRPAAADQTQAIQIWRRLRGRLWLAWAYLFAKKPLADGP